MRRKLLTFLAFAVLIAGGTVTAGAVAGKGPASAQQTVSSSTPTSTSVATTTTTVATTTTTPTPRKITICHHARKKNGFVKHVTIRINRSAWRAHQKHGDSIGACNTATAKKFHSTRAHVKKFHRRHK
jgi:hypothetical protein